MVIALSRASVVTASPATPPRPAAAERRIWTLQDATRFLRRCHDADPLVADLVEVLIGTGILKGEAGLHWNDVHPDQQVLYIRYTLFAVNNCHLGSFVGSAGRWCVCH